MLTTIYSKNLFRLTLENVGSYSWVFNVCQAIDSVVSIIDTVLFYWNKDNIGK